MKSMPKTMQKFAPKGAPRKPRVASMHSPKMAALAKKPALADILKKIL